MHKIFYSLGNLTIGIFFLILGILCMIFPWSSSLRAGFIQILMAHSMMICLLGIGFIVIGLSLVIHIALSARHGRYVLRSGAKAVSIDERAIQDCLNFYWKDLFPNNTVGNQVTLKKNKIHLSIELPSVPESEQENLLKKIDEELTDLLDSLLGYRETLYLSVTFLQEKSN
jgi:hypothetical protein